MVDEQVDVNQCVGARRLLKKLEYPTDDALAARRIMLIDAAIREAVAAEREAIAVHFEECHLFDPTQWFRPQSVAEFVRKRGE